MKYLPLVWRNLMRRKTRTTFTVLSIVVAFLLFGILAALNMAFSMGVELAGNNPDQFLIGSGPISSDFLSHISFQGFLPGAIAFDRGGGLYEIVPIPEPTTILGALVLVGLVGFRERRRLARTRR